MPVVLCRPLGWEAEATYRSYLRWAEELARSGFSVLRFDYQGTGDSPGSDEDPGRLGAWVASVHAAIETAKRLSGSERVALAGMHLGGSLAALAGAERQDVASLVTWGAFARGKAYVRHVRAYRLLNALPGDPSGPGPQGDEEAAGYRLTAATVGELERLDLTQLQRPPAPKVMLFGTQADPSPGGKPAARPVFHGGEAALAKAWTSLGADVEGFEVPGWRPMMQEPRKAVVPEALLAASVAFLDRAHPTVADGHSPVTAAAWGGVPTWTAGTALEEAVCLGPGGMMSGVLSRPLPGNSKALPTVLPLTTASHHRIGPNRLWVRLARALSARGVQSLRFDLPGVGDSLATPGLSSLHAYSQESVAEVRAAMDAVQRSTGETRFILVGLCSGAFLTYHSAIADPRVVGAVLVNPQTFTWKEGDSLELKRRQGIRSRRYYLRALRDWSTWRRALQGKLHLFYVTQILLARAWERLCTRARRLFVPRGESNPEEELRRLVARGTSVQFVFSADDEGLDMLTREAGPALPELTREGGVRIDVIEGAAHTFEQLWAQEVLTERIVEWTLARFAPEQSRQSTG